MTRLDLVSLLLGAVGLTVLLGELPWFRRDGLATRLGPYAPPTSAGSRPTGPAHTGVREVLGPLALDVGARLSRAFGVTEDLAVKLVRTGSPLDVAGFRLRQLTHAVVGLAGAGAVALAWAPAAPVAIAMCLGVPLLWVLADEQRLSAAAADRRRRMRLELPVVAEQLGILLSAGYSLPAALARLSRRGTGVVATDLTRVTRRIRQGLSETDALREWAELGRDDGLDRLVAVLALHREAGDLAHLISAEARSIRAEAHRQLVETIERRSQLVWVPVTVATLVPGLLFLAVPFVSALSKVTGPG